MTSQAARSPGIEKELVGVSWIALFLDSQWGYKVGMKKAKGQKSRVVTGRLRVAAWDNCFRATRLSFPGEDVKFIGASPEDHQRSSSACAGGNVPPRQRAQGPQGESD